MFTRALLLLACGHATLADPGDMRSPTIPLWPWPSNVTSGDKSGHTWPSIVTSKIFTFSATGPFASSPVLTAALKRYERYAFGAVDTVSGARRECPRTPPEGAPPKHGVDALVLDTSAFADGGDGPLRMHGDESYELSVPVKGAASCKSRNTVGALRCLETFHQLLQFGHARYGDERQDDASEHCNYLILGTPLAIQDAPRFTHRGLLVDTGRDYHSVSFLKKTIESLAWNKMSVLHWHIVEVDSFPLQLESFPQLAKEGAFASNQHYTKADVAEIIAWGKLMGVRVMPELEMPGHMSAYNLSLPELKLTVDTGARHGQTDYGIANFASEHTLPTMKKIVAEAASMFEDDLFFFGGDETACAYNECDYDNDKVPSNRNQSARCPNMYARCVADKKCDPSSFKCPVSGWMQDAPTAKWARAHSTPTMNLSHHAALFDYFASAVELMLAVSNKTPAWWNDRFDTLTAPPDHAVLPKTRPIVENWLRSGPAALTPYLRSGWRVWQGHGWYLGKTEGGYPDPKDRVPGAPGGQSHDFCVQGPSPWEPFYLQEPHANASGATAEELKLLLGGEASSWGDCIDADTFENMAWPATSAVAERLWSPKEKNNVTEAFPRLAAFRCSMVRRGVRVNELHPGSCWGVREI